MKLGELDTEIIIERATRSANAVNELVETWATLAEVWASKEDIRDGERIRAQGVQANITTRFQFHYCDELETLNPKDRIRIGTQIFNIFSVKNLDRNQAFEVTAAARADI